MHVLTSVIVRIALLQAHHGGVAARRAGSLENALLQGFLVARAVQGDVRVNFLQLVHRRVGRAADGAAIEEAQLPADRTCRDVIETGVTDEGPDAVAEEVDGSVRDGLPRSRAQANCHIYGAYLAFFGDSPIKKKKKKNSNNKTKPKN